MEEDTERLPWFNPEEEDFGIGKTRKGVEGADLDWNSVCHQTGLPSLDFAGDILRDVSKELKGDVKIRGMDP